jgi:hypothetical protein
MIGRSTLLGLTVSLILGGCSGEATILEDAGLEVDENAITYWRDARPIFDANCTTCHTTGGIGPFALDGYATAVERAELIPLMVQTGQMPPWQADPDCRHYVGERLLAAEDQQIIIAWVEGGQIEGNPDDYAGPPLDSDDVSVLGEPDLRMIMPEPYTPQADVDDDYRCFPLEHTFQEDTYVTSINVTPGVRSEVHHVLLYLVQESQVAAMEELDDLEDGPGYTCFGGPRVGAIETVGGWVPGSLPRVEAEGSAIRIPAGSRIVMQIHYHPPDDTPIPDQTALELYTMSEEPEFLIRMSPIAQLALDIEANDPEARNEIRVPSGSEPLTIVGVLPHMHMLGAQITVTAEQPTGEEICLARINDWDFQWQQFYQFLPDEEVVLEPGGTITLECVHDNSADNQPYVDGDQIEPRDVTWGDGTRDEMCLSFMVTRELYTPEEAGPVCPGFQECYDDCDDLMTICMLTCTAPGGRDCGECVVRGVVLCVRADCESEVGAFVNCLTDCVETGDIGACLAENCIEEIGAFDACAAPIVARGACDTDLAACEVDMSP